MMNMTTCPASTTSVSVDFQFKRIIVSKRFMDVAAEVQIQTKRAACEIDKCRHPFIFRHLQEVLEIGLFVDSNKTLIWI